MNEQLNLIERSMRNDAIQIRSHYERMKVINPMAARRAMAGITQHLQEPVTRDITIEQANLDFELGLITPDELKTKIDNA